MPQGDQRGAGWQFYDASYDGIWDGSLLRQGLGQLTDGKLGPDNFKASYYDQDRGKDKVQVPVYSSWAVGGLLSVRWLTQKFSFSSFTTRPSF